MLSNYTIFQRKLLTLTPEDPTADVDFSTDVMFSQLYGFGVNRYLDIPQPYAFKYPPILTLKVNGKEIVKDVPSSLFELSEGYDHFIPLSVDTRQSPARIELTARYHELHPTRKVFSELAGDDDKRAGVITLELILFGYTESA